MDDLFDKGLLPEASRESEEIRVEADSIWVARQRRKGRGVEIKAMCGYYEGKEDGARVGTVHHALVGDPKRFWEGGVAHIAGHYSLPALKRCYTGSEGEGWCRGLSDHLHGPEIVHRLDPWHVNWAVKTRLPRPARRSPALRVAPCSKGRRAARCAVRAPGDRTG